MAHYSSNPSFRLALSLVEVLIGGFIVIGHNVFHVVPNEVPILLIVGWISLRVRDEGWKIAGLKRPESWWKTLAWAIAAAAILQLGGELLVLPVASRIWPEPEHVSQVVESVRLGWPQLLKSLVIVWTLAAFGEELSYRGYLLTRVADIFGRSKIGYVVGVILIGFLFGFAHYYKGMAGVMDSTYSGLVYGGVFIISGRNLWAAILAHGISDTFAMFVVFMGWAS